MKEEIIAMPTETVYGLAGNAYSDEAVKKIFSLKKRPLYNPLIVHIKSADFLDNIAMDIPAKAIKLAKVFWPGPLTMVLKKQSHISSLITAGKDTVAIRVPNHPVALELLNKLAFPLAAPSANPFGCISPTTAVHVSNYFNDDLAVILDGGTCENGVESTIIGFKNEDPILYRFGSISVEEIEAVVGTLNYITHDDANPDAPGMLSRHYAPATAAFLTDNINNSIESFQGKRIGLLVFKDEVINANVIHQEILSTAGNMKEATKNLYAALFRLDKSNLDIIIAEKLPEQGLGKTINDRLQRAIKK